ncbi:MAG: hypothetical protein ACUBOA_11460 [Candidatus Loosdrechtia sp.]|uniref:hypothetical protein n=1 Tax=Candidatus Loosdrechtia sp. TaxID=3101272 RepID=UPI003A7875AF|nr:MAG: hypothetical protein QY305_00265 [Candidatus Jettenia sp. AMX2]
MSKRKQKLTVSEKAERKRRRKEYMTIFINGKQKRIKRPEAIEGDGVDEFIRLNADPIWLHQNEMWEYMEPAPEVPGENGLDLPSPEKDPESKNRWRADRDYGNEIPF